MYRISFSSTFCCKMQKIATQIYHIDRSWSIWNIRLTIFPLTGSTSLYSTAIRVFTRTTNCTNAVDHSNNADPANHYRTSAHQQNATSLPCRASALASRTIVLPTNSTAARIHGYDHSMSFRPELASLCAFARPIIEARLRYSRTVLMYRRHYAQQ